MAERASTGQWGKRFGERKQRLVLYVGLLFATLAAILVLVIANSGGGGGDVGSVGTRAVAVANQEIPTGTRITADMLKVEFLSPEDVDVSAYGSRGIVVDRTTITTIAEGDHIVPTLVSDKVGEGLAFVVSPGMRALSIFVFFEVVTAGGNVEPGDKVDIIGVFNVAGNADQESLDTLLAYFAPGHTIKFPGPPRSQGDGGAIFGGTRSYVLTVTLAQDLKVLGLAQSLAPQPEFGAAADSDPATAASVAETKPEPEAVSATLEVTPDQAQLLTLADTYGLLRMSARAVGDTEIADVTPVLLPLSTY